MAKRKADELLDDSISSDGRRFTFDFMTSLQNLVMAKIITDLWMKQDMQQEIINSKIYLLNREGNPLNCTFGDRWRKIEEKAATKVCQLFLAKPVAQKLADVVPLVGNSIREWIRYHDVHIFKPTAFSAYSAVDFMSHIKWTPRAKIDYAQTAKSILANEDSLLTFDHKFKLACTYCFKDHIASLESDIVDKYDYLDRIEMNIYPMVHLWISYILFSRNLYNNSYYYYHHTNHIRHDRTINANVFRLLLTRIDCGVNPMCNEVPIRYMWSKLSKAERIENLTLLIEKLGVQDVCLSLLSTMEYEMQQSVLRECSAYLLCSILNDWLWGERFLPTALHMLHIMKPLSYFYVLAEINREKTKNSQKESKFMYNRYKAMFRELWQKGSKSLKDFVFTHEEGCLLEELVFVSLSWQQDMDLIRLVLNDLTPKQKRELLFRNGGIRHCVHLIKSDEWDLFEVFVKHTLSAKEDLSLLKEKLLEQEVVTTDILDNQLQSIVIDGEMEN